jgi:hypothetical protein
MAEGHCEVPRGCPWPSATVKFYKFYFFLFFTLYLVYSFLEKKILLKLFYCISLSLFHLFPFLFYSFCVFTFFLVYVCFMFFYFYVFIYLVSIFFFKKIIVFLICSIMKIYIFLNYIFVWLDVGPPVFPKDLIYSQQVQWAGVCLGRPALPCPCLALPLRCPALFVRQPDTTVAFIYKIIWCKF